MYTVHIEDTRRRRFLASLPYAGYWCASCIHIYSKTIYRLDTSLFKKSPICVGLFWHSICVGFFLHSHLFHMRWLRLVGSNLPDLFEKDPYFCRALLTFSYFPLWVRVECFVGSYIRTHATLHPRAQTHIHTGSIRRTIV